MLKFMKAKGSRRYTKQHCKDKEYTKRVWEKTQTSVQVSNHLRVWKVHPLKDNNDFDLLQILSQLEI